jgi:putative DNA primase/helicase
MPLPRKSGIDWNDEGVQPTVAAFTGASTNAAPILSASSLERVDLRGATSKQLSARLKAVTTPRDAAVIAFSVAARLFMTAPAQTSLASIRAYIEATLPAGLIHPSTLDGIMERLNKAMDHRREAAMAAVTIPPRMLARHRHERCTELPALTADDYHGVIVLWAPMGSGKTRSVGRPFIQWAGAHTGTKPLAICHRVSLVHDMAGALGIEHYGEVDASKAKDPMLRGLATCLPSITTTAHANLINQATYVFVDEISQVLRFLSARDYCRTKEADSAGVYNKLCTLVTNATCVIVADAGCDARTLAFLEKCRPGEPFRIIQMQARHEHITAGYHVGANAPAAVVGECLAELAAGGHVWIATESARRARNLGAFFEAQGYRVMAVHASNKTHAEQAAFLEDPEGLSLEYDVVIASPVIGSGLSIEHTKTGEWFTLGAFVGGGHRITPADAAQALRRVRYLRRFSLGLLPNSEVGEQSAKSIKAAWLEASELEGTKALPNAFTDLVAEIIAADDNARADFAAGLLWQLARANWQIHRCDGTDPETAACLSAMDKACDEAHRAALLAAPAIDDRDARQLEKKASRTELQDITLEAYRIRRSLNVGNLNEAALDFWDSGAGLRRLERFSAWQGVIPSFDDTGENQANRRYWRAMTKAYHELFDGFDPDNTRVSDDLAEQLLDRMIERRHLLAHLGIVSKSYGAWKEDKDGKLIALRRPKNSRQEVAAVLHRMGLAWKRREGTATPTPARNPLGVMAQGGGKSQRPRFYQVTAKSLATMREWAERRNIGQRAQKIDRSSRIVESGTDSSVLRKIPDMLEGLVAPPRKMELENDLVAAVNRELGLADHVHRFNTGKYIGRCVERLQA